MLTEEQAKEKWCPMSPAGSASTCCIGSGCMLWTWVDKTHSRQVELWSKAKGTRVNSAFGDDAEWRPVHGNKNDEPPPAVGYCGFVRQVR